MQQDPDFETGPGHNGLKSASLTLGALGDLGERLVEAGVAVAVKDAEGPVEFGVAQAVQGVCDKAGRIRSACGANVYVGAAEAPSASQALEVEGLCLGSFTYDEHHIIGLALGPAPRIARGRPRPARH
jgi:hypothetical protein